MTPPSTVLVRLRWANGEIETLMHPVATGMTVINRRRDGNWHSFRRTDEIDSDGYVLFVQEPQPN
jgi:hypothetical protein